jgi:transposase
LKEWTVNGTWERIWRRLLSQLDAQGEVDWRLAVLDGSFVRATRGGSKIGQGFQGKGSKVMAVVDGEGLPLGLYIDQAQAHEIRLAERTVATIRVPQLQGHGRPRTRPVELVADAAYDSRAFRQTLTHRGIRATIARNGRRQLQWVRRGRPPRTTWPAGERWKVERTFAWMDNCRRLVVRYDRAVEHYHAFCLLAFILWCLARIVK